jgi:hypothetical protein
MAYKRGPSRIRTGDGGFAIRCLTAWLRGQGPKFEIPCHRGHREHKELRQRLYFSVTSVISVASLISVSDFIQGW